MNRRLFFLAILVLYVSPAFSQNQFYIQPGMGIAQSYFSHTNRSMKVTSKSDKMSNVTFGVLLGYYMESKRFSIETGIRYDNTPDRFTYDDGDVQIGMGQSVGNQGFIVVPVNVKYHLGTGFKSLVIVPHVGTSLNIQNARSNEFYSSGELVGEVYSISAFSVPIRNLSFLINAGMSVEYNIFRRSVFTLSTAFNKGFDTVRKLEVNVIKDGEIDQGEIGYEGTKLLFTFGLRLPVI